MTNSSKLPPFRRPGTLPPLGWNAPDQQLDSHPCGLIVFDHTVSDCCYTYGSVLNHKCGDDFYHPGSDDGTHKLCLHQAVRRNRLVRYSKNDEGYVPVSMEP